MKMQSIVDEHKVFSKVVSKENSISNPSFRIYYGGLSGSVPFMWESQPGTPKHKFSDDFIPPLTPPPSYYTKNNHDIIPNSKKISSRSKFSFHTLFLRINLKKLGHMPSPSSSLSSSSWSSSSSTSLSSQLSTFRKSSSNGYRRRRLLSVGSSFDGFETNRDDKIRGCYSTTMMKKALLAMVGRGSG